MEVNNQLVASPLRKQPEAGTGNGGEEIEIVQLSEN
jgi:hypothetical protein